MNGTNIKKWARLFRWTIRRLSFVGAGQFTGQYYWAVIHTWKTGIADDDLATQPMSIFRIDPVIVRSALGLPLAGYLS